MCKVMLLNFRRMGKIYLEKLSLLQAKEPVQSNKCKGSQRIVYMSKFQTDIQPLFISFELLLLFLSSRSVPSRLKLESSHFVR